MRNAGEPIFEHDFPPGSDMAGEIRVETKEQAVVSRETYRLGASLRLPASRHGCSAAVAAAVSSKLVSIHEMHMRSALVIVHQHRRSLHVL